MKRPLGNVRYYLGMFQAELGKTTKTRSRYSLCRDRYLNWPHSFVSRACCCKCSYQPAADACNWYFKSLETQWLLYIPLGLISRTLHAGQCLFMCCVQISEHNEYFPIQHWQTGFITQRECVYCAVRIVCFICSTGSSLFMFACTALASMCCRGGRRFSECLISW